METRVELRGQDEIRELGDAFNSMADRLVELQDNIRKQERQVMFGRIAAGLVHDLSHPIQNIGNSCKLILKMWEDSEYRDTFRRMVEREMQVVKRVLEDLQNIAKPIPLERFPIELNRTVGDAVEAMQALAETAGITLRAELSRPSRLYIEGDLFALGRVYRNLVVNAIQATAPGGLVVAAVEAHGDRVQVRVYDTGCGIPADRLQADLRGLRHDEAARPRPRPRHLTQDRRTARRPDQRRQRSRQGHHVRDRFPAHQRAGQWRRRQARSLCSGKRRCSGSCLQTGQVDVDGQSMSCTTSSRRPFAGCGASAARCCSTRATASFSTTTR